MAIKVTCDTCLAVYNLSDNKAGTRFTCRKCEATILVPGRARGGEDGAFVDAIPVEEDEPTLVAPLDDEEAEAIQSGWSKRRSGNEVALAEDRPVRSRKSRDEDEDEEPRNRRRRRADEDEDERGPKKGSALPLILGGVGGLVLVLAIGGTLAWIFMTRASDATSSQAKNATNDPDEAMKAFAVEPRVVKDTTPLVKPEEKKEPPKEVVVPPPPPVNRDGPPADIEEALARLRASDLDRQKSASDWLQGATLNEFRRNDVAKALDPLLKNPKTKESALRALAKWGTRDNLDSVHPLIDEPAAPIWEPAFDTLGLIKDESSIDPVGKYLADVAKGKRAETVLRLIGKKGEPQVLKYIHHKEVAIRARAANLLKGYGTTEGTILDQTIQDIEGNDKDVRLAALKDLAQKKVDASRQARASKALEGLLSNPDATVKQNALSALQTWATTDNVPALVGALNDAQLKRGAIQLLGKLKDGRASAALTQLLIPPGDRGEASKALHSIGSPAEAAVRQLLNQADPGVRHEAFHLIGLIGTQASIPTLRTIALKVPALKAEANNAIRKITARGG